MIVLKAVIFSFLTRICFLTKKIIIFLGLCIYFCQESVKMILQNHLLKTLGTAYDMLFQLV